jgi:hypothetical protein
MFNVFFGRNGGAILAPFLSVVCQDTIDTIGTIVCRYLDTVWHYCLPLYGYSFSTVVYSCLDVVWHCCLPWYEYVQFGIVFYHGINTVWDCCLLWYYYSLALLATMVLIQFVIVVYHGMNTFLDCCMPYSLALLSAAYGNSVTVVCSCLDMVWYWVLLWSGCTVL